MNYNDIEQIKKAGFVGFRPIKELSKDSSVIPSTKGVYLILNPAGHKEFLTKGTGGYFNGKEPNVSLAELNTNWVDGTIAVYIGKATTLKTRLGQYFKFGQGKSIGHYGGRFIWQLKNLADLVVCWKVLPDDEPATIESEMIADFKRQYGKRPFANLRD